MNHLASFMMRFAQIDLTQCIWQGSSCVNVNDSTIANGTGAGHCSPVRANVGSCAHKCNPGARTPERALAALDRHLSKISSLSQEAFDLADDVAVETGEGLHDMSQGGACRGGHAVPSPERRNGDAGDAAGAAVDAEANGSSEAPQSEKQHPARFGCAGFIPATPNALQIPATPRSALLRGKGQIEGATRAVLSERKGRPPPLVTPRSPSAAGKGGGGGRGGVAGGRRPPPSPRRAVGESPIRSLRMLS